MIHRQNDIHYIALIKIKLPQRVKEWWTPHKRYL